MITSLTNKRFAHTANSTIGLLHVDGKPFGFVIEDEPRAVKVLNETRIPSGSYKLGIQPAETPMTMKYREKYKWFKNHIELMNVPGFTGVYMHVGNFESDTAGCQLVGLDATITDSGEFANLRSTSAFQHLYEILYPLIATGKTIMYHVIDGDL